VEQAARGSDNLVPLIIDAVQRSVTVGEISDTLRGVFGEHREATSV
jgi:methylmalonyl-CoA mutase N-terminal domain/subunit